MAIDTRPAGTVPPAAPPRRTGRSITLTAVITWFAAACFVAVLLAVLASVLVASVGRSWGGDWLPSAFGLDWYRQAWDQPNFQTSIITTFKVAIAVVFLALLLGVPAGYVLARRRFPGRGPLIVLILLPAILPPLTYAVQLAALMYRLGLGGTITAVVLVNLVPILPLVILITIPFVEKISPSVEDAARVFGANNLRLFIHVLVPLLTPGIVAAGVLSTVKVLGSFELTFFVSSARSQTLVVTIFGALSDPGGPPAGLTAAMTVFYMAIAALGLVISLRFTDPADALSSVGR